MNLTDGTTTVLPDDKMRELGFTDRLEGRWYLCRTVGPAITLNITIDKISGAYSEYVLDEHFGQPAYYGHFRPTVRDQVRANVDTAVAELTTAGLTVIVLHSAYGIH